MKTLQSMLYEGFQRTEFNVVRKLDEPVNVSELESTVHLQNDRNSRIENINRILGGFGDALDSFVIDTKHPNGYEVHTICSNGVIVIQNERTKKFITALIARPAQVKRYYSNSGEIMPVEVRSIIRKCRENQDRNFNNW